MRVKNIRRTTLAAGILLIAVTLTSCAFLQAIGTKLRGELVGNDYVITQYDNFGSQVLRVFGDKITLDGTTDTAGEQTSYITITIDGAEWEHVGSTLVFAQNGANMITDFTIPDEMHIENGSSTGLMAADRFVNHYANLFGSEKVVLVSSQNGTPIGLFTGEKCYKEIPSDLPKTTMAYIDGKMVYVHRGNIDILPASLFNSGNNG